MVRIKDIISVMEKIAPPNFAVEGDRIGLQVGDKDIQVDSILLCLDITEDVIEEAKKRKANLIIAHHPLIYKPLEELIFSRYPVGIIKKAISYNISVYVAHTNLDAAAGGVNDALLKTLGKDLPIKKTESLLPRKDNPEAGLGKVAVLGEEKNLREIALIVKNNLSATNIKISGKKNAKIRKIALCGGKCSELLYPAWEKGAQLFITGELGYHYLLEARSLGISVIEAGHYETEVVVLPFLRERLEKEFKKRGWEGKVFQSKICTSPYLSKNLLKLLNLL